MDKWNILIIILVVSASSLTITVSLRYATPIGWDLPRFHMKVIEEYANGRNGMFAPIVMKLNGIPYPPLFHLLFVPSFWLGIEYQFARFLQALLLPCTLIAAMWLIKIHSGKEASVYCGMFLLGSLGFMDRLLQAIPQSLDFLLFPIVVNAYLQRKCKILVLTSLAMIYNHGFVALVFLGGIAFLAIVEKRKNELVQVGSLAVPVLLPSFIFLLSALNKWSGFGETPQEKAFIGNPLAFTATFLGLLTFGFALVIYLALFKRRDLTQIDKISILTLVSLLIMLPIWIDRWYGYVTLPLAFLLSRGLAKLQTYWKLILIPFIIASFLFFYSIPWLWLINNTIYVI